MAARLILAAFWFFALNEGYGGPVLPSYDTIVVGMGAAGTTAATTLARAGKRVLALEAQDRVGGRVWTRPLGDGVVETGAEWIHGQFPSRVYDLAVKNNISIVFQDDLPYRVHRSDGSGNSQLLVDLMGYCIALMEEGSDVNEPMGDFIEKRVKEHLRTVDPGLVNDTSSLESLFNLMDLLVDNYEASDNWRDVTAFRRNHYLEGNQGGSWHRYGYKTFFEILLNTYKNGPGLPSLDIKLGKEVTGIQWAGAAPGVVVACRGGERYSADNVIVTVSLGVLKERHSTLFSPPLPQEKINAIEVIQIGVVDKIILHFDEPWPAPVNVMFYWIPEDRKNVADEDRWITKVLGTSAPAGANNTLTLWLSGENAKLVESLPEEVVKRKSVELLQRFVGPNVTVPQPVAMIRTTWFSNPFTRGSYTFDSPAARERPALRDALAAPLRAAGGAPRVLFAGEASESAQYATVHGASDSGHREARRLLSHNKI